MNLPRQKYIRVDMLDKFNKKNLKQLLSLPATAADPELYILSGTLRTEEVTHQRAIFFFGNIARLPGTSVERQLALRQLSVKSMSSSSKETMP